MALLPVLMPSVLGNVGFINNLLTSTGVLLSLLPQLLQNGGGQLGVLPSPVLPPFLGGPGHDTSPWGNRTANNTNYYEDAPSTGITRYYDLHVSRGRLAPDGYQKDVILINGQFPGPLLEANWGDYFQITVHNDIAVPEEGTALHWHGESFVYHFKADLYGSSWYHSHYSAQYTDGAYGPMVIYGPEHAQFDIDLGPVMLSDYYHKTYTDLMEDVMGRNAIQAQLTFADNTLIQGKMNFDCSTVNDGTPCQDDAGIAKFHFEEGKIHKLRLINPSSFAVMLISIDHHEMEVIANDFVPIVPYKTDLIVLAAGQRADVLVKAKPSIKTSNNAYWLRVRQPPLCALASQPFALAAIYYNKAKTNSHPISSPHTSFLEPKLINCANDPLGLTEPLYAITPPEPNVTVKIDITTAVNETSNSLYEMNGSSFRGNYNEPVLRLLQVGDTNYGQQSNIYDFGTNESVRIVVQNHVPFTHPMHIHGQNMFVLDEGVGAWDGKTSIRPSNPQRRDTQILQPNGYIVIQLMNDNPGVWPFHCHFAWHVSQGLYVNIIQKKDKVKPQTEIPEIIKQTCDEMRILVLFGRLGQPNPNHRRIALSGGEMDRTPSGYRVYT
ncbi:hypothetical protein FH972_024692 [Carpinus fangiana]|uniref:Laccase n=1 Tax=Carpinus fangiana TaxID=176857 RepID=A0A5N6KZ63_9ROSI|nr:hypothetical protein FH972_024692 [Carpinus fangiana]